MSRPRPSPRWHLDLGFIFLSFDIFGIFVFFFSFIGDGGGAAGPSSLRVFRRGARPTTRRPDWTCHNSINRLYMTFFFQSPILTEWFFFWLVALCVPYLGRVFHRAAARAVLYLLRFFDFVAFFLRRFFCCLLVRCRSIWKKKCRKRDGKKAIASTFFSDCNSARLMTDWSTHST